MKLYIAPGKILFQLLLMICAGNGSRNLSTQDIALNPGELKSVVQSDLQVIEKLEDLLEMQLLPKHVAVLAEAYISEFKDTIRYLGEENGNALITAITRNPVATYRFLYRIVNHLPHLREKLAETAAPSEIMEAIASNERLSQDDVQDAMLGLLRIQYVYNLSPKEIADGVISGIITGAKLQGLHSYHLGIWASNNNFHTLSIEWLEVARVKSLKDRTVNAELIQTALQFSIEKHDELFSRRWEFDTHFYNQKLISIQHYNNFSSTLQSQRSILVKELLEDSDFEYGFTKFWEMCSKGSLVLNKTLNTFVNDNPAVKPLKCFYETKVHPYWTISPLKLEMLSRHPEIYQIYDILNDGKIHLLKKKGKQSLQRSTVNDEERSGPGARQVVSTRTSVGTKFKEREVSGLGIIPEIIQQATGLNVVARTSAEDLQVAAYSFGGHYDVHIDYFKPGPSDVFGGRIATFMFYLSEPELGGFTVFRDGNAVAKPIKGSAVVWHNVLSDGSADYNTYHGACPVILGEKWVANKWIGINDQFIVRKCSLNRHSGLIFPYEQH